MVLRGREKYRGCHTGPSCKTSAREPDFKRPVQLRPAAVSCPTMGDNTDSTGTTTTNGPACAAAFLGLLLRSALWRAGCSHYFLPKAVALVGPF